ncbi:MAG: energy-coupling factor transport system substrate-specific component, partial [Gaiellaceae bacterium]|nr:energy-coupling factor transport system substrate-specific component [Gaiellaceae bacterium]
SAYLESRQSADGGFSEPGGGTEYPQLTAWAALGLHAAGRDSGKALQYLQTHEQEQTRPTDIALVALAEAALGADSSGLLARLPAKPTQVNEAVWSILALRQAGRPAPRTLVTYVLRAQARNGGFSWLLGGKPDSNDTAAAVEALSSAGVHGKPVTRALTYLRTQQNKDGGFRLTAGRTSDAQSTAFAIQAFVAARATPPRTAFAFLAGLRRPDGSYRYSRAYAVTPVWVTAQVLPALAKKPFPLR